MRILHLIPVGLSLLDKIERGALPRLRSALAVDELPGSADTVRDALAQSTGQRYELDLDRLGLTEVPRTASALDSSMAAEWTSVAAVRGEARYANVDGEACVFIATDNDLGLRAAVLVAAHYHHTIYYLHEPLTVGRLAIRPGDVFVCRIPDLNLGDDAPTHATWRSLGAVGWQVAEVVTQTPGGEWAVVVHLSGGYKAMIPYVMILAEGIHSRMRVEQQMRAVAIHDPEIGTNPTRKHVVVDVPVRRIEGDLLIAAEKLKKLERLIPPDSNIVGAGAPKDLLGLFIERAGSAYRVTDPGLIVVNVL